MAAPRRPTAAPTPTTDTAVTTSDSLSLLQRRVLDAIAAASPEPEVLMAQLAGAKLGPTELTGVGFFLPIEVPESAPIMAPGPYGIGDVVMESDTMSAGAGFVLFVVGGRMVTLEGYAFDGEWPDDLGTYRLLRATMDHASL